MTGRGPFIVAAGLRYAYREDGPWILDDIDLEVRRGEHVLVAGASGSGKSTLARTLNGLIPHFYGGRLEGEVRIGGVSTRTCSPADLFDQVGMVFQNPEAQLFNRSVRREIAFGLESQGLPRPEMRRRIDEIGREMDIAHLFSRSPDRLSGGEQQMVAIAAIAALRPKMIVLDEPFANLDGENIRRIQEALSALRKKGTGVIVCEHRLGAAAAGAGRMIVVDAGRKVLDGPPADVLDRDMEILGLERPTPHAMHRFCDINLAALRCRPTGQKPPLLAFESVFFEREGRTILHDLSFSIDRGECVAVVGPNGAGKTTLLKHFNGLLRPTRGRVLLRGHDIQKAKVSHLARHVGMAFQNPAGQFFKMTVRDEITVAAKAMNCFDPEWIDELVRIFKLDDLTARAPYRLSSGEKKRAAFAAALSARPEILVLDEPTSGQDRYFKDALGGFLTALRTKGQTVILVTHDLQFAAEYAPRWLYLENGRITADGSPCRTADGACKQNPSGRSVTALDAGRVGVRA